MSSISIPIENKRKSKVKIWVYSIKRNGLAIVFCLFCFGLVVFSKTNLAAAKNGLILWATAVVPSLFPFFVSTELLGYTNVIKYIGKWLNPILRPLFNVPGEGAFAFLMGLALDLKLGIVALILSTFLALPYAVASVNVMKKHEFPYGPFLAGALFIVFFHFDKFTNLINFLFAI